MQRECSQRFWLILGYITRKRDRNYEHKPVLYRHMTYQQLLRCPSGWMFMCVSKRQRQREGETKREGERERERARKLELVSRLRGRMKKTLKILRPQFSPQRTTLHFENLISTIMLNILTLCLGSCALLSVVTLSSLHVPASSDITKILQQSLGWLQLTAQQCSVYSCSR